MKVLTGNRIFILVAIVVLIAFLTQIPSIPHDAAGYPLFLIVSCLILSIAILIKKGDDSKEKLDNKSVKNIVIFNLAILVYLLSMSKISYLLSTLAFLYFGEWILGFRIKKVFILFPIILTLAMYLLFTRLLGVILPEGSWITLAF